MPSRFDEAPEEFELLTPEVAERVVERFAVRQAERQHAEAAERERLAAMTRVQELADLLGTTPEDVQALAQETRETPYATRSPLPPMQVRGLKESPRWPIHAAYLVALAACFVWGLRPPAAIPPAAATTNASPTPAETVWKPSDAIGVSDPGLFRESPVPDPSVVHPPSEMRVKILAEWPANLSVTSSPGETASPTEVPSRLQASIRSLLSWKERSSKFTRPLPRVDYASAPLDLKNGAMPNLSGFHSVEIADRNGYTYRAYLPDARYPHDPAQYEREIRRRLDAFVKPFVPRP